MPSRRDFLKSVAAVTGTVVVRPRFLKQAEELKTPPDDALDNVPEQTRPIKTGKVSSINGNFHDNIVINDRIFSGAYSIDFQYSEWWPACSLQHSLLRDCQVWVSVILNAQQGDWLTSLSLPYDCEMVFLNGPDRWIKAKGEITNIWNRVCTDTFAVAELSFHSDEVIYG